MKTSNSIRYAVVVAVLGLSAAVSLPHALAAAIENVHPADMCVKLAGGANIVRLSSDSSIANTSPTAFLHVSCDVVNKLNLVIGNQPTIIGGTVSTRDKHPSLDITCRLCQAARVFQTGNIFFRCLSKTTAGASDSLYFLSFDPPDPTGLTGLRSNNFYGCSIPPAPDALSVSTINFYSVHEEDLPYPPTRVKARQNSLYTSAE